MRKFYSQPGNPTSSHGGEAKNCCIGRCVVNQEKYHLRKGSDMKRNAMIKVLAGTVSYLHISEKCSQGEILIHPILE